MFNFAINVKISAADIAEALINFQRNSEKVSANPALPASQQGALSKPPPPAAGAPAAGPPAAPAPAAKKAPPPGGPQAKAPAPAQAKAEAPAAPAEPEKPLPKATWESPPHCQQQGHRDYEDKTKWKADDAAWKLVDDCLLKLVPTRLEPPARRRRIPQDRPPIEERQPAAPAPGMMSDSDLLGQTAAAASPGAKLHGPPPAGPPPPQPSAATDPPPGLSGTGGTGGPDGESGDPGGQKECKQQ